MKGSFLKRLLFSRWRLHTPCAVLSLLACIPALWPRLPLADDAGALANSAGTLLFCAFCVSAGMMVLMVVHLLLRLRNKKAVLYLLAWGGQWALAACGFVLMALVADVAPLPVAEASQPIQQTDTLHPANEELTGPAALVIPISPESHSAAVVESTPNLSFLEEHHQTLLSEYLEASPRWAAREDDTFYSRPGHVVMVPPTTGGTPGLVHVCFRRLVEGDPLPRGYRVVKSGDAFPKAAAGQEQVPDLALDLGRDHYLLLAWRGTSHAATAHKALNAAIAAVDSRMQELAQSPTAETAAAMNRGKLNMTGHTPELRLCEPPAQFGAYQAEIYANSHEPGTLLVYIRELETNRTLRILNCPALYSENRDELFRHDLPGSVPLWMREGGFSSSRNLFAQDTPLFAIREGEPHRYFGVAFEVRFKPVDPRQPSRLILRRCYKVEAYEKPAPSEPATPATKRTPDELTPSVALPAPQAAPKPVPTPAEADKPTPKPAPAPELQPEEPQPEPAPAEAPVAGNEPLPTPEPEPVPEMVDTPAPAAEAEPAAEAPVNEPAAPEEPGEEPCEPEHAEATGEQVPEAAGQATEEQVEAS